MQYFENSFWEGIMIIAMVGIGTIGVFFFHVLVATPYLCHRAFKKPSRNAQGALRVNIKSWIMQNLYCRKLQYPGMTAEQTITPDNLCDLYLGLFIGVLDFLYDKLHNLICPPVTSA